MVLDISKLSNAAYGAAGLSGLLLATPTNTGIQAQNGTQGLGPSLLFNFEGEQSATLESDITDHFTEDNNSLNDQIALRPEIITTQGFVGELNNVIPPEFQEIKTLKEKLVSLAAYAPELSLTAARAYNLAFQGYQAVKTVQDNVEAFTSGENQTEQQKYYALFYGYWAARTLFTVQTPWALKKNMVIKTLRVMQEADTESMSTFEVTFKQMKFSDEAVTTTRLMSDNVQQGRSYNQGQQGSGVDGGVTRPKTSTKSFSSLYAA